MLPKGFAWNTSWAASASDGWLAGFEYGQGPLGAYSSPHIVHWDGQSMCGVDTDKIFPDNDLRAVERFYSMWGGSASDIWAVGDAGTVLHWNGQDWRPAIIGDTRAYLRDIVQVIGTATNDVYALAPATTFRAFTVYHWNGSAWSVYQPFTAFHAGEQEVRQLWLDGSKRVWAAMNEVPGVKVPCLLFMSDGIAATPTCQLMLATWGTRRIQLLSGAGTTPVVTVDVSKQQGYWTDSYLLVRGAPQWATHKLPFTTPTDLRVYSPTDIWVMDAVGTHRLGDAGEGLQKLPVASRPKSWFLRLFGSSDTFLWGFETDDADSGFGFDHSDAADRVRESQDGGKTWRQISP